MKTLLINLLLFSFLAQARTSVVLPTLDQAKEQLFKNLAILPPGSSKDEARKNLARFINFIYDKALEQTGLSSISSGSFMVEDEEQKLFLLLKKLVRFIADKKVADDWMCKEQVFASTDAYPRKSSHLNEWITLASGAKNKATTLPCPYTHYGVDFKKGELKQPDKNHLLFGYYQVNGKNMIFLKSEKAGLRGSSFLDHALGYVKSKLGVNEEEGGIYRKERIPKEILKNFKGAISDADYKLYGERAHAFGIHEIMKIAQSLMNKKSSDKLAEFVTNIKKRYPDYCMRLGDEIILTKEPITCES